MAAISNLSKFFIRGQRVGHSGALLTSTALQHRLHPCLLASKAKYFQTALLFFSLSADCEDSALPIFNTRLNAATTPAMCHGLSWAIFNQGEWVSESRETRARKRILCQRTNKYWHSFKYLTNMTTLLVGCWDYSLTRLSLSRLWVGYDDTTATYCT